MSDTYRGTGGELPEFAPYEVLSSDLSVSEVTSLVNEQLYHGYGSNLVNAGYSKIVATSLLQFEQLMAELSRLDHLEFVDHAQLLAEPCPPDRIRVGIRHDIDMDIVAALQQAEIEQAYGVRANWLVLHTAAYYGRFKNGVFHRYESMGYVYRRLQELGHEVSLHTDALMIYQQHGIDGAQALVTELEWLRSQGINIFGTTAHNHYPSYGAENFEIFKGYVHPQDIRNGNEPPDHVVHNGRAAPLHRLDETALGLRYEGNQVFWQKQSPLSYGAIRTADRWNWRAHTARLKRENGGADELFCDQDRMLHDIRKLRLGRYLVLVIHPVYYGARYHPFSSPVRRRNEVTVESAPGGWERYRPLEPLSWSGEAEAQDYQVVHHPNEDGMLDFPRTAGPVDDHAPTLLFAGADNINGLPVQVPVQCHSVLRMLIERGSQSRCRARKLAYPQMGLARLWPWLEAELNDSVPELVVLGVSDQIARLNLPATWSAQTGISAARPAGDYLAFNRDTQSIEIRRASPHWRAHRMSARNLVTLAGIGFPVDQLPPEDLLDPVSRRPIMDVLMDLYRYVIEDLLGRGCQVLLLLEANGEGESVRSMQASERSAYQRRVSDRLADFAAALDVPLADPYRQFEILPEDLPAVFPGDGLWNNTGHRVAASVLYPAVQAAEILPPAAP